MKYGALFMYLIPYLFGLLLVFSVIFYGILFTFSVYNRFTIQKSIKMFCKRRNGEDEQTARFRGQ